jgi:3-phenylpropionate/trans-cinnamate dioxygenase ferredoxin subunit
MMGWIRVCARSELLPGEFQVAYDGDTAIAVFNVDGAYYAIEDVCTHDGGELAGARFDLRTGAALCPPAYLPTVVFPVKVEDEAIWTRDHR